MRPYFCTFINFLLSTKFRTFALYCNGSKIYYFNSINYYFTFKISLGNFILIFWNNLIKAKYRISNHIVCIINYGVNFYMIRRYSPRLYLNVNRDLRLYS